MGLGMTEIVLILVIALIIFGPRKLPELGKSMGQAMFQFRKASDDFKRTWEQEVEYEKTRKDGSETATNNEYEYNSSESNDPYNPYGDSETAQTSDKTSDNAADSSLSSQNQKTDDAVAPEPPAASKKHWI
jgi:sec-independent protein translocase protein TatA